MVRSLCQGFALLAVGLCSAQALAQVPCVGQTAPLPNGTAGDVAIVFGVGADAGPPLLAVADGVQSGLYVFAFDGGLVQTRSGGPMRGVDFRNRLDFAFAPSALLVAGAAATQELLLFEVSSSSLRNAGAATFNTPVPTALALHHTPSGETEVFAAATGSSVLRRIALTETNQGLVQATPVDLLSLSGEPSSLVVDDRRNRLYAAIPSEGIWGVDLVTLRQTLLAPLDAGVFGGEVAGIAFYPLGDGGGLLLTAVPSKDDVAVHAIAGDTAKYVTRFYVEAQGVKVRWPQFLDVVPHRLAGFDAGLLVLSDQASASCKIVRWEDVAAVAGLPVDVPEDQKSVDAGGDGGTDGGTDGGADGGVDGGVDGGGADGGGGDGGADGGFKDGGPGSSQVSFSGSPNGGADEPNACGCASPGPLLVAGLFFVVALRRRQRGAP